MQAKKRNYEVSIWSLQDEFITVLKPSNIENKGQISDGKTTIRDDGTLELSFSIPMYYYVGKTRIENPIWYTTRNGVIMQDMRKIKLIFNKEDAKNSRVFEFLIINVQESHKDDILTCEISAESMIFNELGKLGYKISLSSEEFYARDYDYAIQEFWTDQNGKKHATEPRGTLNYWLDQFLTAYPDTGTIDKNKWYYKIEMDWTAYSNIKNGNEWSTRESNKVYEDEYIGSWKIVNNSYAPSEVVYTKEKERMVDLEESNIYNLTQDLAETFGVFCRYEYIYDANYHIIGRVIIFYNNYIKEKEGYIDLIYPYSTSAITRERDSKDVTTKMFVRPITDDASESGLITIMDVAANKSKEDYLLNFDYLRTVGAVTEEQYAAIEPYEVKVGEYNQKLKALEGQLMVSRNKMPELEAEVTLRENAIQLDQERLNASNALLRELERKGLAEGGSINVTADNPVTAVLKKNTNKDAPAGSYYIDLTEHGVYINTLRIYRTYNFAKKELKDKIEKLENELKTWMPEYDEFGNVIKINNLYKTSDSASSIVYLTYQYVPYSYYENIYKTWTTRLHADQTALTKVNNELTNLKTIVEHLQKIYDTELQEKRNLIADFEQMMGPALRESYWQPEDYRDHGENYIDTFTLGTNKEEAIGSSKYTQLFWDDTLFDDENAISYEYGVTQEEKFYPCIKLNNNLLNYITANIDKISFIFYEYGGNHTDDINTMRIFPLGSLCQLGFVTIAGSNEIQPVLIITGVTTLPSNIINSLSNADRFPQIGIIKTDFSDPAKPKVVIDESSKSVAGSTNWIFNGQTRASSDAPLKTVKPVYPRIKVKSLSLKTNSDMLALSYNNKELVNYEDYYVLTRDDTPYTFNNN